MARLLAPRLLSLRLVSACGLLMAVCALAASPLSADEEHTKDSLEKIRANLAEKKAVLVDVREPKETAQGYVRDAARVPLSELQKQVEQPGYKQELVKKLGPDKILYTYCRSGRRSVVAAGALRKLGFEVRPLQPGYQDLVEAGFESEK